MLLSLLFCLVEAWVTKDWPPTQPIRIGRILRQTLFLFSEFPDWPQTIFIRKEEAMRQKFVLIMLTGVMVFGGMFVCVAQADETMGLGNQVSFRGGWAGLTSNRANELFTDVGGTTGVNNSSSGYYVGGALDLLLSHDVWGMVQHTWALGEIGVEFKRWNSQTVTNSTLLVGNPTPAKVQLTMLTVDIAPKIKFWEGERLRPWIIPVGLDFHVISPPSNQTTVLDIGVQFGAGADYRLYKAFVVGVDGRFHLASGATNTTNNFGTVGGYVGISF
jgi:hypothetical protein